MEREIVMMIKFVQNVMCSELLEKITFRTRSKAVPDMLYHIIVAGFLAKDRI